MSDHEEVRELLRIVHAGQANAPRTLQKLPGPSELGRPCPRRLAYKLLEMPHRSNWHGGGSWYATVGTGMHAWLTEAYRAFGGQHEGTTLPRYRLDWRVDVGDGITGTLDVYDAVTGTVIDWKVVGKTTLDAAGKGKVADHYRTQVHCYGRGVVRAGKRVDRVAVLFIPRNGQDVRDAVLWSEPYSEGVALVALERLAAIRTAVDKWGFDAPHKIRTEFDRCGECPWFDGGGRENGFLCEGAPAPRNTATGIPLLDD